MLFRRHIIARERSRCFQTASRRCFYFFFGNCNIGTLWFFYFLSEDAKTKKSICNNCRSKSLLLSFMYNYSVTFRHYITILIYAALWWLHSSSFAGRVQLLWRQQLQGGRWKKILAHWCIARLTGFCGRNLRRPVAIYTARVL